MEIKISDDTNFKIEDALVLGNVHGNILTELHFMVIFDWIIYSFGWVLGFLLRNYTCCLMIELLLNLN